MGNFKNSPMGFIYSFAFLGTFFALKDFSKFTLVLGLYSTQLIIGLFMGEKVSLLSIPCGLLGSYIFTLIFPFILLFLLTFWIIQINWIEPLLQIFIIGIQSVAKLLNGSFTSSSIFLIMGIWVLMMTKNSRGKYIGLCILFFLHTNTAMTPVMIHA
ncbi:MAG: hypothetical protein K2Q18_00710 [Bdellovibrionales bacterium]|nr:hypothetical protein [Bdellovibrionales bacterium]